MGRAGKVSGKAQKKSSSHRTLPRVSQGKAGGKNALVRSALLRGYALVGDGKRP